MRPKLFTDDVPPPDDPRPADALDLPSPGRRGLALRSGQVWHGPRRVPTDGTCPGAALDALLGLSATGALHRVPPSERAILIAALDPLIAGAHLHGPTLDGLRRDGLAAAAAAVAREAAVAPTPPPPGAPLLVHALAADAAHRAGGPRPTPEQEAMLEWADWVLSPGRVYVLYEQRYELDDEDAGLLWCGLARCASPDVFIWLRSAWVILHECSPAGAAISAHARDAVRALLARTPGPNTFSTWQDDVVAVLDDVRHADRAPRRAAPTPAALPLHGLSLTTGQEAALGARVRDVEVLAALEEAAAWFPDARQAGAVPMTAFRAVRRALDRGGPVDDAFAPERVLGAELVTTTGALAQGTFRGVPVDPALGPALLVLLRQSIDHPDDLDALTDALRARPEALSPAGARRLGDDLQAFTEGWPDGDAPWWRMLPRALAGATWTGPTGPTHPGAFVAATLGRTPSPGDLDRLLRLDLLADLAHAGTGPLIALGGRREAEVSATAAPAAARCLVVHVGGAWFVDTAGRIAALLPAASRLRGRVQPDGSLTMRAPEGEPTAPPLEQGDAVLLEDGTPATLAEVRGTTAKVHLVEDGYVRYRNTPSDTLRAAEDPAPHAWQVRARLAALRRRLHRVLAPP